MLRNEQPGDDRKGRGVHGDGDHARATREPQEKGNRGACGLEVRDEGPDPARGAGGRKNPGVGASVPEPLTRKVLLQLEPPRLGLNQADADRLADALARVVGGTPDIPLGVMRGIPAVCRDGEWRVTATLGRTEQGWRLVTVEPGNTVARHFGVALDFGTTTVAAQLVDLATANVLGTAADRNGQVSFGEDILTRIHHAGTPEGLRELQRAALDTVNDLVDRLARAAGITGHAVTAVAVAANTTMVHLLLGLDPSRICREPYIPVVNRPGFLRAGEIGLAVHPEAVVYCLPSVGSYLGGDAVGGILVSGMHRGPELSLFVDIGTNGEIVLGNKEWLVACAGAAGPALEGGVVRAGMMALPGAIERVRIDPRTRRVTYRTIGDLPPLGLCGSGLVDCLAEMLLAGIVDRSGRFTDGADRFTVVPARESGTGRDIVITQTDIANLLRTKAAVTAALETLLDAVGCRLQDIACFYAAGAFGQHLDVESAITIGLYPDLPRDRIVRLGNSALEGARRVLLSSSDLREVEEIARRITYFELNVNQEFMQRFAGSRFMPHTDLDLFPTVKARLAARGLATA